MHHGTCVTHVPRCMSGSLTRGGWGKRSQHSRRLCNPQFYVSCKRPIGQRQHCAYQSSIPYTWTDDNGDEVIHYRLRWKWRWKSVPSIFIGLCVWRCPDSRWGDIQRCSIVTNLNYESYCWVHCGTTGRMLWGSHRVCSILRAIKTRLLRLKKEARVCVSNVFVIENSKFKLCFCCGRWASDRGGKCANVDIVLELKCMLAEGIVV